MKHDIANCIIYLILGCAIGFITFLCWGIENSIANQAERTNEASNKVSRREHLRHISKLITQLQQP